MIITIDGPAGTGKSSVAQAAAEKLAFDFLDTGAMYRAVALCALRRNAHLEDQRELAFIARAAKIVFDFTRKPPALTLNGEEITHQLRGSDVTRAASFVAQVPEIRQLLVAQQRAIGAARPNLVTEGRDQGSVVFPDAELKIFLDAAPAERARRRAAQLRARGEIADMEEIQRQIVERDTRDSKRSVGPLTRPKDAHVIDTTHLSQDQVVQQIVDLAHGKSSPTIPPRN
ncbi:MAG: (d)CMP kinase [Tepidisphaeraceae bacterium]|jgi:cytidylate kinase